MGLGRHNTAHAEHWCEHAVANPVHFAQIWTALGNLGEMSKLMFEGTLPALVEVRFYSLIDNE